MYADADTLWTATLDRNPGSFMAENNLGTSALRKGDTSEAVARFRKVIDLQPDYEVGHYNLGDALVRAGHPEEALAEFEKAVAIDPAYAKAHNNLGNLFALKHDWQQALRHYDSACRLNPKNPDSANNLAWLLATCPDPAIRDGRRAVELATQSVQQTGSQDAAYLGTLAAAYAEAGKFNEAVATARSAMELALVQKNPAMADVLKKQLSLYEKGSALRTDSTDSRQKN
jgi:tetratricopeptide (TPR) repeat protein